jgi:hypothetical protein
MCAPVQDPFTECKDRHFLAEPGFDQGDPALRKSWKVMITFHAANDKSPCYIGVYQYKLY